MVRNSNSITISPSREFEIAGSRRNFEDQQSISNSIEKSSRTVLLLDNQLTGSLGSSARSNFLLGTN